MGTLLKPQFYCKIPEANLERTRSMKELLDKCYGRVYWLRKRSRNERTLRVRETGNEVEMKRGRGRGQLMATEVIDVSAFTKCDV